MMAVLTHTTTPRWHARFQSFQRALDRLGEPVATVQATGQLPDALSADFKDEVDRKFELTYELACQTLRDYLQYKRLPVPDTPEALIDEAYAHGLIDDPGGWEDLLASHHRTIDSYSQRKSQIIFGRVVYSFYRLLRELEAQLERKLY